MSSSRDDSLIIVRVSIAEQPVDLKVSLPVLMASSHTTKSQVTFQVQEWQSREEATAIAFGATLHQLMPDWTPRDDPGSGHFYLDDDGVMYRAEPQAPNGWVCLNPNLLLLPPAER